MSCAKKLVSLRPISKAKTPLLITTYGKDGSRIEGTRTKKPINVAVPPHRLRLLTQPGPGTLTGLAFCMDTCDNGTCLNADVWDRWWHLSSSRNTWHAAAFL